jgi:AraC-like DNA-binding protein
VGYSSTQRFADRFARTFGCPPGERGKHLASRSGAQAHPKAPK